MSPFEVLKDKLGEDIFNQFGDASLNNAYEEAFKFVNNLIADTYVLESLGESGIDSNLYKDTSSSAISLSNYSNNRRILGAMRRTSAGSGQYYKARRISQASGDSIAQNSDSIFYENDKYKPAWYFNETGGLQILPAILESNLWDNSGGQTVSANVTWNPTTGTAKFTSAGTTEYVQLVAALTLNSTYRVSYRAKNFNEGGVKLRLNDSEGGTIIGTNRTSAGTYTELLKIVAAAGSTEYIRIFSHGLITDTHSFEIDNIEVQLLNSDTNIYYLTYPIFGVSEDINGGNNTHLLSDVNFRNATEDQIFPGIPLLARNLVYTQTALNLIGTYLSKFVHEEEDEELVALLNAHKAQLDIERKEQAEFVTSEFGDVGFKNYSKEKVNE